jgi:epoxyqueuosine reductase QueG
MASIEELRGFAADFVAAEAARADDGGSWCTPLLAAAPVDGRFASLPAIAADDHLHPRDLLAGARSVVVFFIPFKKELVRENRPGDVPCRNWGLAYVRTNELIERLSRALAEHFAASGHRSGLTPATHNFDEQKLTARWSHKHLGHLCGLGRFGTHCMLITPAGCAGRLGSLVTEAELPEAPLVETREACLLKAGKECGRCIEACPVEALKVKGFARRDCWERLKANRAGLDYFSDLPESTHVCGKCAALMPCSFHDPVAHLKSA